MIKNLLNRFELLCIAVAFAVAAAVLVIREGLSAPTIFMLCFMAVFAAVIGIVEWLDNRASIQDERFRRKGICVKGRITSIDEIWGRGIMGWDVGGEFDYKGQRYLTASRRQRSRPEVAVGDAVNVYLMPDDPADNRILDDDLTVRHL